MGGKLKGKKIFLPSLTSTRSTKNLLKKSFFDTLQFQLHNKIFIELFGGSGSMGIEAVSRGCSHAIFFEKDLQAYKILEKNCSTLLQSLEYKTYSGDTFSLAYPVISSLISPCIVYCDPPFSVREGFHDVYDKLINLLSTLNNDMIEMLIIEHETGIDFPHHFDNFILNKSKKFGKSTLSYYLRSTNG